MKRIIQISILLFFSVSFCGIPFNQINLGEITSHAATLSVAQQIKNINAPLSAKNKAAKFWIAMHESGGSYTARNGNCYGRYQLLITYLHGNYSAVNQEKVANEYVKGRYGSWIKAKKFWQIHHWY